MANALERILGDQYNIQEGYNEIAEKYFNISPDTSKLGLYGWISEIMAHDTKKDIFQKNVLYKEFFFNTASLPISIFNAANADSIDIPLCTPSSALVILALDWIELIDKSINNGNKFIIERDVTKFRIGNYYFSLPYSVEINFASTTSIGEFNTTSVTAKYILEESYLNNEIKNMFLNNPFIKVYKEADIYEGATKQFLFLALDVYQVEKVIKTFEITSANIVEKISYEIEHINELANFNVFFKPSSVSPDKILLPKFQNNLAVRNEDKFVFFNYIDENKYQIYFSTEDKTFLPPINSSIIVETFTSNGKQGNFNFIGSVSFINENRENEVSYFCKVLNNPGGGISRPNIKEIKKMIFLAKQKAESLATENDLNNYFSNIASSNFQNGSKIKFIKYRDDLIKREFNGFILAIDNNDSPLPTNTIDIGLYPEEINFNSVAVNYNIKSGSLVVYDPETGLVDGNNSTNSIHYRLLKDYEYPEDYLKSDRSFIFAIPYHINISFAPLMKCTLYNMYLNYNIITLLKKINDIHTAQFIINNVRVNRNPLLTEKVTISCNINTEAGINIPEFNIDNTSNSINTEQTHYRVFIQYEKDDVLLGYNEMKYNSNNKTFEISLESADDFNKNKLNISNTILSIVDGSVISNLYLPENMNAKIIILLKKNQIDPENWDSFSFLQNNIIGLNAEYSFFSIYNLDGSLDLFNSLEPITRANIKDVKDISGPIPTDTAYFVLNKIPVFGAHIFYNINKYSQLMETYNNYMTLLKSKFDNLANATDINIKFFNTYGVSKNLSSVSTNISLEMDMKVTRFTNTLDKAIKNHIINFIKNSNETQDRIFNISNLIKSLENQFSEILYIVFKSLNNTSNQQIKPLNYEQNIEEVPEFLNIGFKQSAAIEGNSDIPNININYL